MNFIAAKRNAHIPALPQVAEASRLSAARVDGIKQEPRETVTAGD
jgi:hypothetical protein